MKNIEAMKEQWFETHFQDYSGIVIMNNFDNDVKQKRLLKKLIDWLENFDNLEGVK